MAFPRVLRAALPTVGLALALSACAPAEGSGAAEDIGYETVIAAVVLAESDAGGRAFEVEIESRTAQVEVFVGDRAVAVEVDLAGPAVRDRRDEGEIEDEDRTALNSASTTLADGIRIAVAAHRGDRAVSEAALRADDDAVWTVEFTDGGEVAVAVADGSIVR